MKKININGRDYIKLSELRHEIKRIRDGLPYNYRFKAFSEKERNIAKLAIGEVIRAIYREELREGLAHAHTPDDVRAVHAAIYDMPGDFIVYRKATDGYDFFMAWEDGHAMIGTAEEAMIFSFESKAKEVAERLGGDWKVMDASEEAAADARKLLDALFREDGEDPETAL